MPACADLARRTRSPHRRRPPGRPGRRRRARGGGAISSSVRSFRLAGSPSAALTTTIARPRARRPRASWSRSGRPRRRGRAGRRARPRRSARPRARAPGGARAARSSGGSPCKREVLLEGHRPAARARPPAAAAAPPAAARGRRGGALAAALWRRGGFIADLLLGPCSLWTCGSSFAGVPERRAHSEPSGPPGSHSSRNSANAPAPPSAALRTPDVGGPAVEHAGEHGRDHDQPRRAMLSAEQPCAFHVAARAEAVQQRDRPAGVGQPVDRAPAGEAHPLAQQARDRDGEQQVEGDRAQAQPEGPVGAHEGDHRVDQRDRARSCRAPR